MRCGRCGNENPGTNRFCGMCGASLLPAAPVAVPEAVPSAPRESVKEPAPEPVPVPAASVPRPAVRTPTEVPPISGHSFLGLNQPASTAATRANLGRGSQLERSSGSLDYLLEDEEEPSSGGAAKVFVILIVLALAGGFGYFHWRQELSSLLAGGKKPVATEQPSPDSGQAGGATAPSSANPAPAASQNQPAPDAPASAAPASAPPASDSGTPSSDKQLGSTDAPSSPAASPTATSNPPSAVSDAGKPPADSDPNTAPAASAPVHAAKPRAIPKPTPAKASDPVAEAEKYIYARGGVQQDCDRGLRTLRPAAQQADPRAMISLGALYSTGVCTPRDLPTAYRWFALALRKQPDNQPLQENLQRLWSQMTQPERQLAIKLSQ